MEIGNVVFVQFKELQRATPPVSRWAHLARLEKEGREAIAELRQELQCTRALLQRFRELKPDGGWAQAMVSPDPILGNEASSPAQSTVKGTSVA